MSNEDAGGRPPHEPDDKSRLQVKTLSAMGLTTVELAAVMQLSEPTLRKYYALEIATGTSEANAKVAQSLFKAATDPTKPNVVAAIFWLKARAGWRDGSRGESEEEPPSKKVLAAAEAKTAAVGTEWEHLLTGARPQ